MHKLYYIVYYCYGLNFERIGEDDLHKRIEEIKELESGEAGKDARKIKFVCSFPASDFHNALIRLIS